MKKGRDQIREAVRSDTPVREVLLDNPLWELHTISPRESVLQAMRVMEEKDVGALVVTEGEEVVGVLSERDCARQVLLRRKDPDRTAVSSVMTGDTCSVTAHKNVSECIELMLRRHVRHLPVFFGRYLVGCVSLRNLMEYLYGMSPERHMRGTGDGRRASRACTYEDQE